jgi:hypothetical protein
VEDPAARSKPPGRSTTASTFPVDGWITTMSMGFVVLAERTACEAASPLWPGGARGTSTLTFCMAG